MAEFGATLRRLLHVLILALPGAVTAEPVHLWMSSGHGGPPGTTVTVPLIIGNVLVTDHLVAFDIEIDYDPTIATWQDIEQTGTVLESWDLVVANSPTPGKVLVSGANTAGTQLERREDGILLNLNFQLNADATMGDCTILSLTRVVLNDGTPAANTYDGELCAAPAEPARADLSLSQQIEPAISAIGAPVTLTLTVHNDGPDQATGVTVTDHLPTGLVYQRDTGAGTYTNGIWSVGTVADGATITHEIEALLTASDQVTNIAEISTADQADPDSTAANGNSEEDDYAEATVRPPTADLSMAMRVDNSRPFEAQPLTFTLTLTNGGPDEAETIEVAANLPEGLTLISAQPLHEQKPGKLASTYQGGVWSLTSLAAEATATLAIEASGGTAGTYAFMAEVTASTTEDPDATPNNHDNAEDDQDTATVQVRPATGARIIIVNGDAPGEGLNDPTPVTTIGGNPGTTLGQQRMRALQHAAEIWATYIVSELDIQVLARYRSLGCQPDYGRHVEAYPVTASRIPDSPTPLTWYPIALANVLNGNDGNGEEPEIELTVNSTLDDGCQNTEPYYYGLDGKSGNRVDAVTEALGGLARGLGFSTFIERTAGVKFHGTDDIFATFLHDASIGLSWSEMSGIQRLSSAANTQNLIWTGTNANREAANQLNGGRHSGGGLMLSAGAALYNTYFHMGFHEAVNPNQNPEQTYQGANHEPGLALQVLYDLGWSRREMADLTLEMEVDNPTARAQEEVTFTLSLHNQGPDEATNLELDAPLPSGLSYRRHSGQGTYNPSNGSWTHTSLANGASVSMTLVAEVQEIGIKRTQAELTAVEQGDPNSTPNNGLMQEDDMVAITIGAADLELTLSVNNTRPNPGETVELTIEISNQGPDKATGVTVYDQIANATPAQIEYQSDSSGGSYDPRTGTWQLGTLNSGATETLTITGTLNVSGAFTNEAEVWTTDLKDPDSTPANHNGAEDDRGTVSINPPQADLHINNAVVNVRPSPGEQSQVTFSLINRGPETATNMEVQLTKSPDLTIEAVDSGAYANGTWTVPSLATGARTTLELQVSVASLGNHYIDAELMTVTQADPDSSPGNGEASEDDMTRAEIITAEADLSLRLSSSEPTANQGELVIYTHTVTNQGPDDATGIEVETNQAAGMSYQTHTGGSYEPETGKWNLASLAKNSSSALAITYRIEETGTHQSSAEISAAYQQDPDSTPGNGDPDEDDYDTLTIGTADLRLEVTASELNPQLGEEITLTVQLANTGPNAATAVTVVAPIPPGLTLETGQSGYEAATGIWSLTQLDTGSQVQLTLNVRVSAVGTKTYWAEVKTSDQHDPDSTPNNRQAAEDDYGELRITPRTEQGASIVIVNMDSPGLGFNDPTPVEPEGGNTGTTLGRQRLNAAQQAADIWGTQISSDTEIIVTASYTALTCTQTSILLGVTAPRSLARDFQGAQRANTWYPIALANALAGRDLNGNEPEIEIQMNASLDQGCTSREWYYGLDGEAGEQIDAVTAIMHELGHGLGFHTVVAQDGSTLLGSDGIYMTQLEDHGTGKKFPQMSNAERAAAQTRPGELHWTGSSVIAASGSLTVGVHPSGHVEMQAPTSYQAGSTLLHFSTSLEPNNLMEPNYQEAQHHPGIAKNVLVDLGWPTRSKADLSMGQTISNHAPRLGEELDIDISLHNGGPGPATGIEARYALPSGLSLINASSDDYDPASGTWTVGSLESGSEIRLQISARVNRLTPQQLEGEIMSSDREDPDSTPGNGILGEDDDVTATLEPIQVGSADLSLTIAVDTTTPTVLDNLTITLTLSNEGPDEATNVAVRNPLSNALELQSTSGDGNYQPINHTWSLDSVPVGSSVQQTLITRVVFASDFPQAAEIIAVTQEDPDSTPANAQPNEDDQDSVQVTPQPLGNADLSVTLTVDEANPDVGESVALTLSLHNAGPDPAAGISTSLDLPAGMRIEASTGDGTYSDGTWSLADLPVGTSKNHTVTATVTGPAHKDIEAQIETVLQGDPDSSPANNEPSEDDYATVSLRPLRADLSLTMSPATPVVQVGEHLNYALTVRNDGPDLAQGVTVTNQLAPEISYISNEGEGDYSEDSGIWTLGELAAGAQATQVIEARVDTSGSHHIRAEITSSERYDPDSTPANNEQTEDDYAGATVRTGSTGAQILIQNADGPNEGFNDPRAATPEGGNSGTTLGAQRLNAFQYAADIWAQNIQTDITIVVEAQFNPLSCTGRTGILGSAGPTMVMRDANGLPQAETWYPAGLANHLAAQDLNGSGTEITANFNSSIDNNENCLAGTNWYYGYDSNAGDNIDMVTVLLHEMGHGLGFATLVQGQTGALFYGRNDAYSNQLEDHETGLGWGEMSDAQRRNSAQSEPELHLHGATLNNATSRLDRGVSEGGHVEMRATNPYQPGTSVSHFSNSLAPDELMEASYSGANHEPGLAANLLTDLGWGSYGQADLSLSNRVDNPLASIGESVTFTVTLTNNGPETANVRVNNQLPAHLSYETHTSLGIYNSSTGSWTVGNIANGESRVLEIQATVLAGSERTSIAEVSTSSKPDPDSVPSNGAPNEDDYAQATVGSADLSLSMTVDETLPNEGETVTLTITVRNQGPNQAGGTTVAIQQPAGLNYLTADGDYSPTTGIWRLDPLTVTPPGEATLNLSLAVATDQPVSIVAEIASTQLIDPDSTPGNGNAGEDDYGRIALHPHTTPKADLSLNLSLDEGRPVIGELVTLTLSVHNDSLDNTDDVTVAMELAPELSLEGAQGEGSYHAATGIWTVGVVSHGQTKSIDILAEVNGPGYLEHEAEIQTSSLPDPDSIPANGDPTEDDMASVTIVANLPNPNSITILNVDGPDEGFNDSTPVTPVGGNTGTTLGQQRLKAFQQAANIWASHLEIGVQVVIEAKFDPLQCNGSTAVLGAAGARTVERDFPGAPQPGTWYHAAQANNLAGNDLGGNRPEIVATINSSLDQNNNCLTNTNWYYGIDRNPTGNEIDLVTVLLHEFAHGLGATSLVNGTTGARFMDRDDAYMQNLEDHSQGAWPELTNEQRVSSAIQTDLHWTGSNVEAESSELTAGRHSTGHVEMNAPNPYQPGSSVTHFSPNLAPNQLMEPHYTGPDPQLGLAVALMRDLGWEQGRSADLELDMTVAQDRPDIGETIQITHTLSNQGPDTASGVTVAADLPAGLSMDAQTGGYSNGIWTVGEIAAGEEVELIIEATVLTATAMSYSAQVATAQTFDPDSEPGNGDPAEDDQSSVTLEPTGTGSADIQLSISVDEQRPNVGEQVVITLTLHNDGPDIATGLEVLAQLPQGLAYESAGPGYDPDSGRWTQASLAVAASTQQEIIATVSAGTAQEISAELVAVEQQDPDSTPNNGIENEDDHASVNLTPNERPSADLELQLTTDDGNPTLGSVVALTHTLNNRGPETSQDTTVRLTIPSGLRQVSDDSAGDLNGPIWTVGTIAAGEERQLTQIVLVESLGRKQVSAEVNTASQPDPDSTPANADPTEDDFGTVTLTPRTGGGAIITIHNADSPGEGFNDQRNVTPQGGNGGTTLGAQRLNAFQYAADIWSQYIASEVEIVIAAQFNPLRCTAGSGILGTAGPNSVYRDFENAPEPATYYTVAMANALTGSDQNGGTAEIRATFNSTIDNGCLRGTQWYYGYDGNPGGDIDLVTVLIHEMAHGLGFMSLVDASGAKFQGYDDAYMAQLEDHRINQLWPTMSNGERATSAVSGSQLHWIGENVTANSGDLTRGRDEAGHVEIYAPNPYQRGSSVSHFSSTLMPDAVMEPSYTGPNHRPDRSAELLTDLGWPRRSRADLSMTVSRPNQPPTPGQPATITLTLSNQGPAPATGVTVQIQQGAALEYQTSAGDRSYTAATQIWEVGVLAETETVSLEITVNANANGEKHLAAEVATSEQDDPDSTPGNNQQGEDDQDEVTLGIADVSLDLYVAETSAQQGEQVTWNLHLNNEGPDEARALSVSFPIPAGTRYVTAGGAYQPETGNWNVGEIASGGVAILEVVTRIEGTGSLTGSAEITETAHYDPDSEPANGDLGEDDYASDSLEGTAPTPTGPELTITGHMRQNCPNMSVRLEVRTEAGPVSTLSEGDFSLHEDGIALGYTMTAVSSQGEYELTYNTNNPDGAQHTLEVAVTHNGNTSRESDTLVTCHIRGYIQIESEQPQEELAGTSGNWRYYRIEVPANQGVLEISTQGGSGDVDLYLKHNEQPDQSHYEYRSRASGNNESVTVTRPPGGSWNIGLHAVENYAGVTLEARYAATHTTLSITEVIISACPTLVVGLQVEQDGSGVNGLSAAEIGLKEDGEDQDIIIVETTPAGRYELTYTTDSADGQPHQLNASVNVDGYRQQAQREYAWCQGAGEIELGNWQMVSGLTGTQESMLTYRINVPANQDYLSIQMNAGSGDADLYIRQGAPPSIDNYDYAPRTNGNDESQQIADPAAGDWYVGIWGYEAYTTVSLIMGYGQDIPQINITAFSQVDCPELELIITASNQAGPITGMQETDLTLSENNGNPKELTTMEEIAPGEYQVRYRTENDSGAEVYVLLMAEDNGQAGQADHLYRGCTRDGSQLDVWINDQHQALAGTEITVPVNVQAVEVGYGIIQWQMAIEYDPALLHYQGLEQAGTLVENWGVNDFGSQDGRVTIIAIEQNQNPISSSEDAILVKLKFEVEANAEANSCSELRIEQSGFQFNQGAPQAQMSDGRMCVPAGSCPRAAGDINNDGNAQSAYDAHLILSMIEGTPTDYDPIPQCVADTNCSGEVALMDAIIVLQRAVGNSDTYCEVAPSGFEMPPFSITIPPEQLEMELGTDIEIEIELHQIEGQDIFGYRIELEYEDRYISLDQTNQDGTATSRWAKPKVTVGSGTLAVTHLSPTVPLAAAGSLIKLTGRTSMINAGSSSLTITSISLASASEPEQSISFTLNVAGEPCFEQQEYGQLLSDWPLGITVTDIIRHISCTAAGKRERP